MHFFICREKRCKRFFLIVNSHKCEYLDIEGVNQMQLIEEMLEEINDIAEVLQQEGENDGKSRYLEIVAVLLVGIDSSLKILRTLLAVCVGLQIGALVSRLIQQ